MTPTYAVPSDPYWLFKRSEESAVSGRLKQIIKVKKTKKQKQNCESLQPLSKHKVQLRTMAMSLHLQVFGRKPKLDKLKSWSGDFLESDIPFKFSSNPSNSKQKKIKNNKR